MFHLEVTDIHNSQKIDTMGIWNIFYSVNSNPSRQFNPRTQHYVLPSQCEHVFYSVVLGRGGWSFVVRHDPRGSPVKYNVEEDSEKGLEEENDFEHDQHELDDHVREEYDEELVELDDVTDNVHEDDIDDDIMIITDIDDDDDLGNPYNVESRQDDTYDDLDR